MPGTDPAQAIAAVFAELPDLPHLPELPGRGPGGDLVGRTAALLVGMPVETTTGGWRLAARPGRDASRAASMLARDLDELEEAAQNWDGPLKVQACGPWTMAAAIELTRRRDPALADPGAVADLTASLAEGVAAHVAEVSKRVPGTTVLLQLDEPSLPAVLAGHVKTASGFGALPRPEADVAEKRLAAVLRGIDAPAGVHCCAVNPPITLARKSGAAFISIDFTLALSTAILDELGEAVEAGIGVIAGLVSTSAGREILSEPGRTVDPILSLWRRLGLAADLLREVAVSPTCGLAGASPQAARAAMKRCREAASRLAEADL